MKENKTYASEPMAMTYGMSDYLVNSGLLTQISELSTHDKQCLISYISEEIADDVDDDDLFWNTYRTDLPPYTLEELHARIEASEEDIKNGRVLTVEQSREQLKREFLWLQ